MRNTYGLKLQAVHGADGFFVLNFELYAQQRLPVLKDRQTGRMLRLCHGFSAQVFGTLCWQDLLRTGLLALASAHSSGCWAGFRQWPVGKLRWVARCMLQDPVGIGVACLVW